LSLSLKRYFWDEKSKSIDIIMEAICEDKEWILLCLIWGSHCRDPNSADFWVTMLSSTDEARRPRGTSRFQLQSQAVCEAINWQKHTASWAWLTLRAWKLEGISCSETSDVLRTTWHLNPNFHTLLAVSSSAYHV
jgi:hypothetical protein